MLHLSPDHVRFYEDGPDWPQTPEQQMAERAYRDAFLTAAHEAGRVAWDVEPVRMHADDAFAAEAKTAADGAKPRGSERQEAKQRLREQLANGRVPSNQLIADAREHGISERTLRRAYKEIGGHSRKQDGQWLWGLAGQDGHEGCQCPP